MAKKKEVRLKKIPLEILLDVLTNLFDMGVDYIDIVGIANEVQDTISIVYSKEYMSKDLSEAMDEMIDEMLKDDEEQKTNIKLSDDDLNQMI